MSEVLDLLVELVGMETVGGGEERATVRCAGVLADAGLEVGTVGWSPGRAQLAARAGGDRPLTFTGHVDVVPVSRSDWSCNPFEAVRDGDRLVGRGTSDMKSGVAALVVAVAAHARRAHACRGVQVVLTAGEETGCTGAAMIPAEVLAPGGPLVVAEPTANRLVPGHKGALWLRLTAAGRAAHGSAPELGDNAAVRLARAAVALHDARDWPDHPRFGVMTANVGYLRGGVQPNIVPDAAELLLDVRVVPGVALEDVRARVAELAGDGVRLADVAVLPPVDTPDGDPLLALAAGALAGAGLEASVAPPARYFTDASVLAGLLGPGAVAGGAPVPCVILGPGEPDQCHVADEWCSVSRLEAAVEVYASMLDTWCGGR